MSLTVKRLTISLTKEDLAELDFLATKFGESRSAVYRRALIMLHTLTLEKEKEK
jgi:metal-responsive CopG/Arc/MetJ family transcriptional regulator